MAKKTDKPEPKVAKAEPKNRAMAVGILVTAFTMGPHGKTLGIPLHEVPLLRRAITIQGGGECYLSPSWTSGVRREKPYAAEADPAAGISSWTEELDRLRNAYGEVREGDRDHDVLREVYGASLERLVPAIRRVYEAAKAPRAMDSQESLNRLVDLLVQTPADAEIPWDGHADDLSEAADELDGDLLERLSEAGVPPDVARSIAVSCAKSTPISDRDLIALVGAELAPAARQAIAG